MNVLVPPLPTTCGRIHGREIGATVDGPGLRYCVFLQGCPLRCQYCHNPDARGRNGGESTSLEALVADIERYRAYLRRGGVTISGGEPLAQPRFVRELLDALRERGFHTAVDTSGFGHPSAARAVFEAADLVLLDIKHIDPEHYRTITDVPLEPTLRSARLLADMKRATWLRYVLVPGLTDDPDAIARLADFAAQLGCIERVDVLPFHQMGRHKWEGLSQPYVLANTREPTTPEIEAAQAIFAERGLVVPAARH